MKSRKSLRTGAAILAALVLLGLAAPLVTRAPNRTDLEALLEAPSLAHPMGTDALGRDVAARVAHGARVSLTVGFLAAAFALAIGVPIGAFAGFRGGVFDAVAGRAIEAVLALPSLLFALALVAAAPAWMEALPDALRLAAVLALTGWTPAARYLRAEFHRLRGSDVVAAARSAGAPEGRIVLLHLLPAAVSPVLVTAAFAVGSAILLEAALSFLGLGVRPPTPTWGGILGDARFRIATAWWMAVFPGACLFFAVLGCNLVGEGIRDWLDPRSARA